MKSDFLCTKEQKRQVFSLEGSGSADYANNGSLEIRFVSIGCLAVSDCRCHKTEPGFVPCGKSLR